MHRFAQTNLQLVNQLHRESYSVPDIEIILGAHELAMRLFTGRFRASGKTFIAHLVGTASILADLRVSARLVAAALIHASYDTGDFGDSEQGISNKKRELLRSAVGEEIEEYVARYSLLRWNDELITTIHDQLDTLSSPERDVLLMRLANELEEYLDLGILYCGEARREMANYLNHKGELLISLAEKLGFPSLAAELAMTFQQVAVAEIPSSILRRYTQNSSFLIAPYSYKRLMDAVASRLKKRNTGE
jgi:(p)ppGpp synthase/HD superfamily hydrolase